MKKATLIILSIVIFGCSKSNQKTASTTPPTTSTIITVRQSFVGNWILRQSISYNSATTTEYSYENYYSPTSCYLNLEDVVYGTNYKCINGCLDAFTCSPTNNFWNVDTSLHNTISVGGTIYNVLFHSTDSLIILSHYGSASTKYILNKTSNSVTQTTKEQSAVKTWVMYQTCNLDGAGNVSTTIPSTNTAVSYSLTMQNTWGTGGGVSGWNCIAGTGTPLYNGGTTYWEIIGADSLLVRSRYYTINTLNSSSLVLTTIPAASGKSYYFH